MEVSGSSKEKECFTFMIREMSKRISLPKQSPQSCQAASQGDTARWDVSLAPRCFFATKMIQTCVNSWGKHPLAALCESDKNNTMKNPAGGYALNGSVFPVREGHCRAELDLGPTHIKAALSKPPFLPLSFPVLTGNRR